LSFGRLVLVVQTQARGQGPEAAQSAAGRGTFEEVVMRNGIPWGRGIHLPPADELKKFLVIGRAGTGKTLLIRQLMQDAFCGKIGYGNYVHGIIYDHKTEVIPQLAGMRLNCPIIITNPFDMRATPIDLARSFPDRAAAETFAKIIVPDTGKETA